ncbi:MAG: hypothetical protein HDT20_05340 [Oscillibacter sp.]|nr:hypothetical protein [Oscillibacter sp.]
MTGISYDNGTVTLHENVEHVSGDSKTITIKKDTDVTIDLNGNNIDGGSDYVITINAGGALTLEDSTGSGAITGSTNRGGVKNSGTFTMNGGTISGNTAKDGGGVNNNGTFTMNGGAISGNTATGDGGGVYNFRGTFTMEDGTIEGNNAVYAGVGQGGGVYNDQTVFTMNGGTISGNKARSMGDEITCASVTELSFLKDSVWDSDGSSDRMYGVHEVYSGEELSSMDNSSVHLKHHEHDFTNEETTQPTCTEPGKVVYSGCSCGQTVEEPIKALGHDMGEWYTVKEAGPGVEGEERCDCNRCDYFETRPIPAEPVTNPDPENPDPENPDPENPDPTNPDPVNPDPTNPTDPTSPTDPTVEVDEIGEADVPLADAPETADEAEEIDEADVSEEPVEIIDEELPLTEMPEIPEIPEETEIPEEPTAIVIEEDDVPLSDVPQTGEASTAMWLAVLLASGMGLVYLNTGKRKENA